MNDFLEKVWLGLNERFFGNSLKPLAAIDWGETSGPNGINAHGLYVHASRCIIIDEQFKVVLDGETVVEASLGNAEMASQLMIHEMVHQSLYEKGALQPGGQGISFFDEAQRIESLMGKNLPADADMKKWPLFS